MYGVVFPIAFFRFTKELYVHMYYIYEIQSTIEYIENIYFLFNHITTRKTTANNTHTTGTQALERLPPQFLRTG